MTHFRIDITTRGVEVLQQLSGVVFLGVGTARVRAFRSTPGKLVLFWGSNVHQKTASFKVAPEQFADFVWVWLQGAEYGPEPDIDGHCAKGFRLYNEAYGRVDNEQYAFLAVQPAWIEYHK